MCIVVVFTVSIAFINIALLLDDFLNFFCKPKGVFIIINGQCFMWKKIRKYIQNSFVKNEHLFINVSIYERFIPIKHSNCLSDKISICILVVLDVTKIRWWKMNFQIKFCKNDLVMRIRV